MLRVPGRGEARPAPAPRAWSSITAGGGRRPSPSPSSGWSWGPGHSWDEAGHWAAAVDQYITGLSSGSPAPAWPVATLQLLLLAATTDITLHVELLRCCCCADHQPDAVRCAGHRGASWRPGFSCAGWAVQCWAGLVLPRTGTASAAATLHRPGLDTGLPVGTRHEQDRGGEMT